MALRQTAGIFMVVALFLSCFACTTRTVQKAVGTPPISGAKYAPHNNQVLVTKASLPTNAKYEVLAQLRVGKRWYGSSKDVYQSLADGAREIGADAVVEAKIWYQPSGFSWSVPHGSGKAVKILDSASVDLKNVEEMWK